MAGLSSSKNRPTQLNRVAYRLLPLMSMLLVACSGGSGSSGTTPPIVTPPTTPIVALRAAFPNLSFNEPIGMIQAPGDASRWYLYERRGRVVLFDNDPAASSLAEFTNLGNRVSTPGEGGLLGFAFHPDFPTNRAVYMSYTAAGLVSRLAHFQASQDGLSLDANSETILLSQDQPFSNHNGGHLSFGPGPVGSSDYLYMGFGDGGSAGDPNDNAQNTFNFHGAILRLDVSALTAYSIPPGNPFATGGGGLAEIYAWGFRNPWRFSFDRLGGALWLGDVGQDRFEEIDIVVAGGNYGWRCYEGDSEFNLAGCPPRDQLRFPVAAYAGQAGGSSVTGGYVYRGTAIPGLIGAYVYGDFVSGSIWALFPNGVNQYRTELLLESGRNIVSFAEDLSGELYVIDFAGNIQQIVSGL